MMPLTNKSLTRVDEEDGAAGVKRDARRQVVRVKTNVRAGGILRETGQYAKEAWARTDEFLRMTWAWLW